MATIINNLTVLAVLDIELSRAYYIEKLGFVEYLCTRGGAEPSEPEDKP